jgi:hypothetical protein
MHGWPCAARAIEPAARRFIAADGTSFIDLRRQVRTRRNDGSAGLTGRRGGGRGQKRELRAEVRVALLGPDLKSTCSLAPEVTMRRVGNGHLTTKRISAPGCAQLSIAPRGCPERRHAERQASAGHSAQFRTPGVAHCTLVLANSAAAVAGETSSADELSSVGCTVIYACRPSCFVFLESFSNSKA